MTARENFYVVFFFCVAGLSPKKGCKALKDSWHQGKQQIARENRPQVFLRTISNVRCASHGEEKGRRCYSARTRKVHTACTRLH